MSLNYEKYLNPVIRDIPPSGIRRFFDLAETMQDVISLGIGEPDFPTPQQFCQPAIESLLAGKTAYSPNYGLMELRVEIANYLQRRFSMQYDPKAEIIVTVGGSEAVDMTFRALCAPDDEILMGEPAFVSYIPCIELTGAKAVIIPTTIEEGFKFTAAKLESYITDKTKAVLLNFPCNPTGVVASREELQAIADVCIKHDLLVISDEIYAELTYGTEHISIATLPHMYERTIVISGVSKAFAMTGWRIGYVCGPAPLMPYLAKVHQFGIMSAPTMGQYAAIEAFRNGDSETQKMVAEYARRRELIVRRFQEIGFEICEPKGAFYAFPSIKSTGLTSSEFCDRLLLEKHVACIPGDSFGASGEGFIRCSYATAYEKIEEACNRIEDFVAGLK